MGEAIRFEARTVLSAAYPNDDDGRDGLTHLVGVDDKGCDVSVACRNVRLEHMGDTDAHTADELAARPTCRACARAFDDMQSVNLDAMSADDLRETAKRWPANSYRATYARFKARAMDLRAKGAITAATDFETKCESLYNHLPERHRW
jgi:hypothetical protein